MCVFYIHVYKGVSRASLVVQLVKNLPAALGRSPGEGIGYPLQHSWASLVAQTVKNLPAMWETWVQSLGGEDPLEEGLATHSSILAWRVPKDREAWQVPAIGLQRVRHN